jgi:quinol monooxygenase YgiN
MKKILLLITLFIISCNVMAQNKKVTRIARLTIDSLQLKAYSVLLKEQMETAVKLEKGVVSYTVYADKTEPYKLTIVEVYADNESYSAHRETAHFKKYKEATKQMVKSLELSEVVPFLSATK